MNTVLFDLDGTLLPVSGMEFEKINDRLLKSTLSSRGYSDTHVYDAIKNARKSMSGGGGVHTNEECFWISFLKYMKGLGLDFTAKDRRRLEKDMTRFYREDFGIARYVARPDDKVSESIDILKQKGFQLVVASDPVMPEAAIREELSWSGLDPDDFVMITTCENSCFVKPDLDYYRYILHAIDKDPEDCMMVGNDVQNDMCVRNIGMDVFLIDTYMINDQNEDIFELKSGNFEMFVDYIRKLPSL